jgi:hypothetical protein
MIYQYLIYMTKWINQTFKCWGSLNIATIYSTTLFTKHNDHQQKEKGARSACSLFSLLGIR